MNFNHDNQAIIEEIRANLVGILADLAHMKAACDRIINYQPPRLPKAPVGYRSPIASMASVLMDAHPDVHVVPMINHNEEEQGSTNNDNNIAKELVSDVVPDNIVGNLASTEISSAEVLPERVQFLTVAEWVDAQIHYGWGKTASCAIGTTPTYLGRLVKDKSPGLIIRTIARKSVEYFLMCSVVSLLQPIYVMRHVPTNSLQYLANNLSYGWSEISPYYVIYVWSFDPGITNILLCVSKDCLLAGKIQEVLALVSMSNSIMSSATNQVLHGIVTPFFKVNHQCRTIFAFKGRTWNLIDMVINASVGCCTLEAYLLHTLQIERNYQFPIKDLSLKMEMITYTSQQVLGTHYRYTRVGLKLFIAAVLETTVYTPDSTVSLVVSLPNEARHFAPEIMGAGYNYSVGSNIVMVLGCFSMVQLLLVYYIFGDYQTGLKCLFHVDSRQSREVYINVLRSHITTIHQCEKFLQKIEQMFGLLALHLLLCSLGNLAVKIVSSQLRELRNEKMLRMRRYDNEVSGLLVWETGLYQAYAWYLIDISCAPFIIFPDKHDFVSSWDFPVLLKYTYVCPAYAYIIRFTYEFVQFIPMFKGATKVLHGAITHGNETRSEQIIDIYDSDIIVPVCNSSNIETCLEDNLFSRGYLNMTRFWSVVGTTKLISLHDFMFNFLTRENDAFIFSRVIYMALLPNGVVISDIPEYMAAIEFSFGNFFTLIDRVAYVLRETIKLVLKFFQLLTVQSMQFNTELVVLNIVWRVFNPYSTLIFFNPYSTLIFSRSGHHEVHPSLTAITISALSYEKQVTELRFSKDNKSDMIVLLDHEIDVIAITQQLSSWNILQKFPTILIEQHYTVVIVLSTVMLSNNGIHQVVCALHILKQVWRYHLLSHRDFVLWFTYEFRGSEFRYDIIF